MPTLDELATIRAHRRFSTFVGEVENLWFEAKEIGEVDFNNPRHRFELAKDVSALANAEGGSLVFGLTTIPRQAEQTDEVSALAMVPQADFDGNRFAGVINEYIFPRIQNLDAQWIESSETAGMGVGWIVVPKQEDRLLPFLINRVVDDEVEIQRIVFGYAKRVGAGVVPFSVEQLHSMCQQGKSHIAVRLTQIEHDLSIVREHLLGAGAAALGGPAPLAQLVEEALEQ